MRQPSPFRSVGRELFLHSGLHLSCTWPIFSEELVTENDECSDFDPLLSDQWAIGVTLLDDLPVLLSDSVQEYMKLSSQRETIEQLLGNLQKNDGNLSAEWTIRADRAEGREHVALTFRQTRAVEQTP